MDSETEKRTTINVKNMGVPEWERAKKCANRSDESMGEWLTRAVKLLADMEEGGREFAPREPTRPRREMSPEQVAALLQGVAATKGNRHQAAIDLRTLAGEMARDALGQEPRPVRSRIAANLSVKHPPQNGQAVLIESADHA